MFKRLIRISLLISFSILSINSCNKIKDNNPTNGRTTAVFNPDVTYGTLTDRDGNIYKTVTIGRQIWMTENLRTTKYNDGTKIPNVTDDDEWDALTTGAYCNYKNTSDLDTIATRGRLYNWYAVNTGKLAPEGWHVATDAEWTELTDYLGENVAADKLKEIGTLHWGNGNFATNETGFTAIPGGYRYNDGRFYPDGTMGIWWSATMDVDDLAWYRLFTNSEYDVIRYSYPMDFGYSVRCIKD